MSFRAISYIVTVVVLLAANSHAQVKTAPKLVAHKLTDAAIVCTPLPGAPGFCVNPPKYQKVPYFPGTTFEYTFCGGRGFERRTITVSATNLTFWAPYYYMKTDNLNIVYVFKTATLIIQTYPLNTASGTVANPAVDSVTSSRWQLSALLDDGTEDSNPTGLYAAAYRQTAIKALGHINKHLAPFAKQNMQRTCGGDQPYSPKVATLVAYLKQAQTTLQKYKPPTP